MSSTLSASREAMRRGSSEPTSGTSTSLPGATSSAGRARGVGLRRYGSKVWSEMWTWIVIVFLYVVEIALFRALGGTGAAGDALRRWGRSSSSGRYLNSRAS